MILQKIFFTMKYLKLTKKIFTTVLVFGIFGLVLPSIWSVNAIVDVPLETYSNTQTEVIKPTPSMNGLFCFVPAEVNQALYGCPIVTSCGFFSDLMSVGETVLSGTTFFNTACDATNGDSQFNPNSGIGLNHVALNGIDTLLNLRPVSGVDYINQNVYALSKLGNVSAQDGGRVLPYYPGLGYQLQAPMQAFWGWSVNIVYGFLIVLIIVVALAISFRQRLGGSAVVTLQNSIPNIALAMILVPLSFAITGLFIDAITVGSNVVHGFLLGPGSPGRVVIEGDENDRPFSRDLYPDDPDLQLLQGSIGNPLELSIEGGTVGDAAFDIIIGDKGTTRDAIDKGLLIFSPLFPFAAITILLQGISQIPVVGERTTSSISELFGFGSEIPQFAASWWIGQFFTLFMNIIFFFTGLRILWLLLKKFFVLMISPVFSPFVFATIAIPGVGMKNVYSFLKSLGAVSIFYIVAYSMILLANIIGNIKFVQSIEQQFQVSGYVPPLLGFSGKFIELSEKIISSEGTETGVNALVYLVMSSVAVVIYLSIPKTLRDIDRRLGTDRSMLMPILQDTIQSARDSLGIGRELGLYGANLAASAYNRFAGVEAGQPGSAQYRFRRFFSNSLNRLDSQSNDPNRSFLGRVASRYDRFVTGQVARALGVTPQGFDEQGRRLPASFKVQFVPTKYVNEFGIITFPNSFIQEICQAATDVGSNKWSIEGFVIMKITAENAELPFTFDTNSVSIQEAVKAPDGATDIPSGKTDTQRLYKEKVDIFGVSKATKGALSIQLSPRSAPMPTDGKSAGILFDLVINDVRKLFGWDGQKIVKGDAIISTVSSVVMSDKIFFVFRDGAAGPVRLQLGATPD
ncbi:MAG: hypothetical protein KatS3mg085_441 [Candidatus Dojkabacteria bacterium]|nr:MAG: hypothetical protein KatS3mg085_441 [Candidatus Dojkabacteria bacterium]